MVQVSEAAGRHRRARSQCPGCDVHAWVPAARAPAPTPARCCSSSSRFSQRSLSADEMIQELRPKLAKVLGINAYMQNPPAIRIGGHQSKSTYQYTLQDIDQDELQQSATKLMNALATGAGLRRRHQRHGFRQPRRQCDDRPRPGGQPWAFRSPSIETALGAAFGGEQISTIYASDAEYWVMLELLPQVSERRQRHQSALCLIQWRERRIAARPMAPPARPARTRSCR